MEQNRTRRFDVPLGPSGAGGQGICGEFHVLDLDRLFEVDEHVVKMLARGMEELQKLDARLLLRRIHVLITVDDVDVDTQSSPRSKLFVSFSEDLVTRRTERP